MQVPFVLVSLKRFHDEAQDSKLVPILCNIMHITSFDKCGHNGDRIEVTLVNGKTFEIPVGMYKEFCKSMSMYGEITAVFDSPEDAPQSKLLGFPEKSHGVH